jgi:Predicted ester cyclase
MSDANKDLVHRWVEQIFNERQADAADDVVAAEFVEHALAPFGQQAPGLVDGPVHTRATVEFLRAQFPDIQMTIEAMAADEDLVSVRVVATGTNLGPLNGMLPPTGRSFRAQQSHWFRVRDGRLAEHWATRDDLSTMLQLGVIPMPGPPAGAPANGAAS